jgi:hypothetical protein
VASAGVSSGINESGINDVQALVDCLLWGSIGSNRKALVSKWLPQKSGSFRHHWHALDPATRSWPLLDRWHIETQSWLFHHLRQIWDDDRPRVMVDLGCHAGHTWDKNTSDALLWLRAFHHPGSVVLGVDIVDDYVLDLQHRFDDVPPYSAMANVTKATKTLAIGKRDGLQHRVDKSAGDACAGTWYKDWDEFERQRTLDHYCRITRQRLRRGTPQMNAVRDALLRLPPPNHPLDANGSYYLRTMRLDSLWMSPPINRKTIDFLKVDIDLSWKDLGIEQLLRERGARVIVLEIDAAWQYHREWGVSDMDQLCFLAESHGYTPLLKVPCRARRRFGKLDVIERSEGTWYHPLTDPITGRYVPRLYHTSHSWGIQDMMLVDRVAYPQLAQTLHTMGAQSCIVPRSLQPIPRSLLKAIPSSAVRAWMEGPSKQARRGFCATTDIQEPSDCEHGHKGVLGLLPTEANSDKAAARACLSRCAQCASCRYISFSRRLADCSWYASCDLARLSNDVDGFTSGPALLVAHEGRGMS